MHTNNTLAHDNRVNMILHAAFTSELFFEINEDRTRDYYIKCCLTVSDTSLIDKGYKIVKYKKKNILELKLFVGVSDEKPSLKSLCHVEHVIYLGKMPNKKEEGTIEIYYSMKDLGKMMPMPDREPKAKVSTSSARERI